MPGGANDELQIIYYTTAIYDIANIFICVFIPFV